MKIKKNIGGCALALSLIMPLASCGIKSEPGPVINISDFEFNNGSETSAENKGDIADDKDKNSWESFTLKYEGLLNQEGEYYLFFYMDTCSVCNSIKDVMNDVIINQKLRIFPFDPTNYKNELAEEDENEEYITNYFVSDIKDLRIVSVPLLLKVENKTVTKAYDTKTSILEIVDKL